MTLTSACTPPQRAQFGEMYQYRAAGVTERRCIAREEIDIYKWMVSVGTYSRTPTLEETYGALHSVIQRHPSLSVVVTAPESPMPILKRADSIDLSEHVTQLQDVPMDELLIHIHNAPFGRGPRWHVYLVPDGRVAFAASHTVLDGVSTKLFHQAFIDGLKGGAPRHAICPPSACNLPPPLDAAGLTVSWWFVLWALISPLLERSTWHGPERRPNTRVTTNVRHIRISSSSLTCILDTCRQHNSGFTALMNHVAVRVLGNALEAHGISDNMLSVVTPLDMRRIMRENESSMANLASGVEAKISTGPLDWDAVHRTSVHIRRVAGSRHNQLMALLSYVGDIRAWTSQKAAEPAGGAVEVSNMGTFVNEPNSPAVAWELRAMTFFQSANGVGVPLNINVASVSGGPLDITLTWWPGMLPDGVADAVAKGLSDELLSIGS